MLQLVAVPFTVVTEVVELPVGATFVTLEHCVADDAVRPTTAVEFHAHAYRSFVAAVGVETDFARPEWRIQLTFRWKVRVNISVNDLKQYYIIGFLFFQFEDGGTVKVLFLLDSV